MIEFSIIKELFDIFYKLSEALSLRKEHKHKFFDDHIKPAHAQLEIVTKQYFELYRSFRQEYISTKIDDFPELLKKQAKQREDIVYARDAMIGITWAILDHSKKKSFQ